MKQFNSYAEKLLADEVNNNLKFLRKVKPNMSETDIKDFILQCISLRTDVSKSFPENIKKMVNNVYENLEM
jgi:hypothetical protein